MSKKGFNLFITNIRRIYSCYTFSFFELLAVKSKFFDRILTDTRKPYFTNEINMAKVASKDRVLHIGCGIHPTHCILIAKLTNAEVVGIDNSKKAVKLARKYVKKMNLSKLVTIEFACGEDYPVDKFDIIFVAINVFPIDDVLKNLSKKLKKGTRILCKSIKSDITDLVEKQGFSKDFEIVESCDNPVTKSYLLMKK